MAMFLVWIGIVYALMITSLKAGEYFLEKGYTVIGKILSYIFLAFMTMFGFLIVILIGGGLISVFK